MINKLGLSTSMCGDGTNDVGSLKSATIGIAVLNSQPKKPEPVKEEKKGEDDKVAEQEPKVTSPWYWPTTEEMQTLTMEQIRKKQQDRMQLYMKQNKGKGTPSFGDFPGLDSHVVELGDACIAAPFTYKFSSVKCVNTVICQGRTTIATTYQMYKILALNSMISAYSMSTLYLDGMKNGDYQMTMLGMATGVLFLMISLSKPLEHLSKLSPPKSIFSPLIISSVLIQFVFHFVTLVYLIRETDQYVEKEENPDPTTEFKPNLKSNVVFIYSWAMTATTFLVNYEGSPFMQSLKENTKLYKTIMIMYFIAVFIVLDIFDFIRENLQLVPFPNDSIQKKVIIALALDSILCIICCSAIKSYSRRS